MIAMMPITRWVCCRRSPYSRARPCLERTGSFSNALFCHASLQENSPRSQPPYLSLSLPLSPFLPILSPSFAHSLSHSPPSSPLPSPSLGPPRPSPSLSLSFPPIHHTPTPLSHSPCLPAPPLPHFLPASLPPCLTLGRYHPAHRGMACASRHTLGIAAGHALCCVATRNSLQRRWSISSRQPFMEDGCSVISQKTPPTSASTPKFRSRASGAVWAASEKTHSCKDSRTDGLGRAGPCAVLQADRSEYVMTGQHRSSPTRPSSMRTRHR